MIRLFLTLCATFALCLAIDVSGQIQKGTETPTKNSSTHFSVNFLRKETLSLKKLPGNDSRLAGLTTLDLLEVLKILAYCESGGRHFNATGKVLQGAKTPADHGILQIKSDVHNESARRMGYDIETPQGNIAYGWDLLWKEGLQPWRASQACWQPKIISLQVLYSQQKQEFIIARN